MEGIYFYWFAWIGWIYITFLMDKTRFRLLTSFVLLFSIILSNKEIPLFSLTVNGAILFYLFASYIIVAQKKWSKILYYLCISLILTSSYVAFRLFQLFDPVWVMFHPTFKLSLILLFLTLILIKEQKLRIALVVITVTQGEIVYTLFLNSLVAQFGIGRLESLDIIAITISLSFLWYGFENFVKWLDTYVKQRTVLGVTKR
jgi:hypothetical protein